MGGEGAGFYNNKSNLRPAQMKLGWAEPDKIHSSTVIKSKVNDTEMQEFKETTL